MNLILVAIVSVILATGVFNTEPKVSEGNKKTEIIVKDSSEKKPTEEVRHLSRSLQLASYMI